MKRLYAILLFTALLLGMGGCSPTMDDVIGKEPSFPGQVNTVYAILLRTPADRESENKG